jgi:hypothetical protein
MIVTVEELNPDDVTPIESDKKIAPPTGDAITNDPLKCA